MENNNTNTANSTNSNVVTKVSIKDKFSNLPKPVKIGLTITGVAAIGAAGYMVYQRISDKAAAPTAAAETVAETVAATVQQSL